MNSVYDVLFPRYCFGENCAGQQRLLTRRETGLLCANCRAENLTWITQPSCLRCGQWYGEGSMTFDQCRNCIDQPHAYSSIRSVLIADEQTMEFIKAWKYSNQVGMWKEIKLWVQAWRKHIDELTQLHELHNPIIIPVPITRASYLKRGFNQAQWLARELVKQTGYDYSDCLISTHKSKQARLLRSQRIRNKGAANQRFDIKQGWQRLLFKQLFKQNQLPNLNLQNRDILLIDDICTTGATAHACAKVLKRKCKINRLFVLTILRQTW